MSEPIFEGTSKSIYPPILSLSGSVYGKESDGTLSKVGIFRDITETKKREGKLRVVEEDYKRLLDHSVAGVYISSKEGKFLNANQALLDMLGYDSKEEVVPDIISAAGL